ncbi:hypothetical protein ONZ43_g4481 [Nemania bipapillata]|uniref:Uncharacterized protein n=1 Tax=Nemania bipapillata TaxID=110536 RepID=A0ACC2IM72_9PEZI|nr:hypothetical protein ONZ43_g4481 [Nemania bipapillata]
MTSQSQDQSDSFISQDPSDLQVSVIATPDDSVEKSEDHKRQLSDVTSRSQTVQNGDGGVQDEEDVDQVEVLQNYIRLLELQLRMANGKLLLGKTQSGGMTPKTLALTPTTSRSTSNIKLKTSNLSEEDLLYPQQSIKAYRTGEEFFNRTDSVHCIEILEQGWAPLGSKRGFSRTVGGPPINSREHASVLFRPSRIRIRSRYMLEILRKATKTEFGLEIGADAPDPAPVSVVFLYPFKLFMRHRDAIVAFLEEEEGKSSQEEQESPSDQKVAPMIQVQLLKELLQKQLKPLFSIREELSSGRRTTLLFEHLWFLFNVGDVVYARETERAPLETHRLWRVTEYGGGREILNDNDPAVTDVLLQTSLPKAKSKGRESMFYVRGFHLVSHGRKIGIEEELYEMPRWEGERHIHDLKIFPIKYCQPGRDFRFHKTRTEWIERMTRDGRSYAQLKPGEVKYLKGIGIDEEARQADYQSQVIIDHRQAALDASKSMVSKMGVSKTEGLKRKLVANIVFSRHSTSLFTHRGDTREVKEIPRRVSAKCCNNNLAVKDVIHDDISLEHETFRKHQEKIRPPLEVLGDPSANIEVPKENYLLFPKTITGFVLSARKWVTFEISSMREAKFDKGLWDELQLPKGYKRALLAKLQGPPGVGKTFTAEALSAYTERPLYRITSGELGDSVTTIEEKLGEILGRGGRWGCVILLDEADIYLAKRDQNSFKRNAVVSAFLRQIEWYPGILIVTSNRPQDFDSAVLQRIHLQLFYPHLNREAVGRIWANYCDEEKCQKLAAERGSKNPQIRIEEEVSTWWKSKYDEATNPEQTNEESQEGHAEPWWSGRRIQFAFREAIGLAVYDRLVEKDESASKKVEKIDREIDKLTEKNRRAGKKQSDELTQKIAKLNQKRVQLRRDSQTIDDTDTIFIKKSHFEEIAGRSTNFKEGLATVFEYASAHETDHPPDEDIPYTEEDTTRLTFDNVDDDEESIGSDSELD